MRKVYLSPRLHKAHSFLLTLIPAGLLLTLVCLPKTTHAQTVPLTLDECIRKGLGKSQQAKVARYTYESAWWTWRSFVGSTRPQLSLSGNSPGYSRSIVAVIQDDGTTEFRPQDQAFSNGTISASQVITPTGGTLSLSTSMGRLDVLNPPQNAGISWQATPFLLSLRQPIFAYNSWKWDKKLQPKRLELAEKRYLEAREDIAIQVVSDFFDIRIAEIRLENQRLNLAINDSIFKISEGRYQVGKIAENELLQTELAYLRAKTQVQQAEVQLQRAKANLAINLGLNDPEQLEVLAPLELPNMEVELDFALDQGRKNRSDWINFQVRDLQADANLAQARANNRPSFDITASFGYTRATPHFDELYRDLEEQRAASIGFNIPLFRSGQGQANLGLAEAQREQTREQLILEKQQLERDMRFQVLDFLQLRQQLALALKSDTIAQRRFEVAKNRYLIGKIDITNLQIAQQEKDNARSVLFQTIKQFWVAYYGLRRATLYDYIEQKPLRAPTPQFRR